MFKNVKVNGIEASRYIASWVRSGGQLRGGDDYDQFRDWLKIGGLSENDIGKIFYLASNGKLELEISAKAYLNKIK